jgi:hypothetical protein
MWIHHFICRQTYHQHVYAFEYRTAILGLALCSILAPILWAIFYDPLLIMLQKMTTGFKINEDQPDEARITALAFADDLTPIATNNEDQQAQLNIIHSFLSFHGMKMNVTKTHVLTNLIESDDRFPDNENRLHLGGVPIASVNRRHKVSRILGFFVSMDGNAKTTLDHAMYVFKNQLKRINYKMVPCKAAVDLINNDVLAKLAYRLQVTALPNFRINEVIRDVIEGSLKGKPTYP